MKSLDGWGRLRDFIEVKLGDRSIWLAAMSEDELNDAWRGKPVFVSPMAALDYYGLYKGGTVSVLSKRARPPESAVMAAQIRPEDELDAFVQLRAIACAFNVDLGLE